MKVIAKIEVIIDTDTMDEEDLESFTEGDKLEEQSLIDYALDSLSDIVHDCVKFNNVPDQTSIEVFKGENDG